MRLRAEDFIRANTAPAAPTLVPELRLYLATEILPLWRKTEEELAAIGVPPPYWAFAWAGGQALARYILDHSQIVYGRDVLDFGSGSGIVALAAAKAGAAHVRAADIDPFARAAILLNAEANGVTVEVSDADWIGSSHPFDSILLGDMCYERPLAEELTAWLAGSKAEVLLGDPGRSYFPKQGVDKLAAYEVATPLDLEDRAIRETGVYRLVGATAG